MLRDIYIPSHVKPVDTHPKVSTEQKLEEIAQSEVIVKPITDKGYHPHIPIMDCYQALLPYTKGMQFQLTEQYSNVSNADEASMFIDRIDLGDENLYGHGIGTRLLRGAVEFGFEEKSHFGEITTGPANIGLVNTIINVVGKENVAFRTGTDWYGNGHEQPLEAHFDESPYREGERYLVAEIRALAFRDVVAELVQQAVRSETT